MNEKTKSTENLLDFSLNYDNDINNESYGKNGLGFQILAKKVIGKRLSFKDCYLMVRNDILQVGNVDFLFVLF